MNRDEYLLHSAGLYKLFAWLDFNQRQGMPFNVEKQIIYAGPIVSKYFAIGIAKSKLKKISKTPFLACQTSEAMWFSLIKWKTVIIREKDLNIYFITEEVKGDNVDYPDIPQFAFALKMDHTDKINLIKGFKYLEGREYFIDEENQVKINFHKVLFRLMINVIDEDSHVLDESVFDRMNSYDMLLQRKLNATIEKYDGKDAPLYEGSKVFDSPFHQKIEALDKLNDKIMKEQADAEAKMKAEIDKVWGWSKKS